MAELDKDQLELLELWIDRAGVGGLLCAISGICREKAEHIRSNWQDEGTARVWEYNARRIEAAAAKMVS